MLVLSRRSEESILVGRNIEIKVLGIRGDHVSLGFTAPPEVAIFRKEVISESDGRCGCRNRQQRGGHAVAAADSLPMPPLPA